LQQRSAGHLHGDATVAFELDRDGPISATSAAGIFAEGSRFGPYVIGPCIGHGDAGRTYRAEHEAIGCALAIEVFTGEFARSPMGRTRFMNEARRAAAVRHPSVVNVFDVGVQEGIPFLVMEYLEGEGLNVLLHSTGALDEGAIVDIMVPIVAGVAALHDIGIVHGGLETSNVFLAQRGSRAREPKLLDFGISRGLGGDRFAESESLGVSSGGLLYAAPETVRGGEATPLSDQYSLGVVMYECASGVNPFFCDNRAEASRRIVHADYLPLSRHDNPPPSLALARIIDRVMSADPAQRFDDVKALGRELLGLASERTRMTWSLSFGATPYATMDLARIPLATRLSRRVERWLGSAAHKVSQLWAKRDVGPRDARTRGTPAFADVNLASVLAVLFGVVTFAWGIALLWSR
jgi:serine/threonine protein kinase